MTWLAPWAWAGALVVAGPILIHLLGRGNAPRVRFPSLRFLDGSPLLPTRWSRLRDPLLLAVRCAILLAAVAALARPVFTPTSGAPRDRLVRVIIIDTSASIVTDARAAAERQAEQLVEETATRRILRTAHPASALAAARAWLDAQSGTRELVIVSDFQRGAVDPKALAGWPTTTGIRLVRVGDTPHPLAASAAGTLGGRTLVVRASTTPEATSATWIAGAPSPTATVEFLPSSVEDPIAASAADAVAAPAGATTEHGIVLVAPAGRPSGEGTLRAPRTAWMLDAMARLRADPLLDANASAVIAGAALDSTLPAVHRDATGRVDAVAAERTDTAAPRLLILLRDAPTLNDRAAWIAAARRAVGATPDWNESETERLTDAELAAAQRAATPERDPSPPPDRSDGRWLWLAALLLLGAEWWLRRRIATQESHALA